MFLFKWIKEYFAIFFLGLIFIWMATFTMISPSGLMGFLFWIGASLFASLMWNALCGLLIGPLYIIVLRPALVIAVKVPLIILRILLHIFVATPLKFMGQSSSWLWNGFEGSIGNMVARDEESGRRKPKLRYMAVFLFFLAGLTYIVGVDIETFTAMMRDATILAIPLIFVPLILTMIVSGIGVKLSGRSLGETAEESYDDRMNTVDQASEVAESAVGIYKDLDHINEHKKAIEKNGSVKEGIKDTVGNNGVSQRAARAGSKADSVVANNRWLTRIAGSLDELPLIGDWLAGMLGGVTGGSAIAVLIVVLIILIVVWLFVALIFIILFGGIMYATVFPFLESTFGVASGYGADIGGVLSTGPDASLGGPSPEFNSLKLAGARVSCMLEGPACMREWRNNNTQRPGSESVGTEFGLEIEEFSVNSGLTLDISTRNQDDTIPIQFDVYNPIQGLRGIEARNVQYRVSVDGGPTTSCKSDWKDLGGQFVGDKDNAIAPGGFARPGGELENLTLKNCGALQPGYSQDMSAELQIKYDYSSQSTLQFQAMEQSYMIDEGMRPEPTKSETADTPVKTYVNVQSPVTFRNPEDGNGRAPIEFPVWVGFETNRFDLEYQVHPDDLKIYSSSLLTDVDRTEPSDFDVDLNEENNEFSSTCSDLEHQSGTEYALSDDYKGNINQSQTEDGNWYTRGLGPTLAQCSMVLAPDTINSISETGESMSIRIDGNYTVRLSSSSKDFEVINNRCGTEYNCPFIVTKEESDAEEGQISAECSTETSVDSTDGCTVLENTNAWASRPSPVNDNNQLSNTIENRETAYNLTNLVTNRLSRNEPSGENIDFSGYEERGGEFYSPEAAVGLEPRNVEEVNQSDLGYAITATETNNHQTEIQVLEEYYLCQDNKNKAEDFVSEQTGSDNIVYYKVPVIDCDQSLLDIYESQASSNLQCAIDTVDPTENVFTEVRKGADSLWDAFTPDSCSLDPLRGSIEKCEGETYKVFDPQSDAQTCFS
ncbi:MAG: hypothetical protein R6V35_04165 [Candidatus Nanohaloarchaea archaeon]